MGKLLTITVLALLITTGLALATSYPTSDPRSSFPSASGMAQLASGLFVVISDVKDQPELQDVPRIFIVSLTPGLSGTMAGVTEDWGDGPKPNDLESIAPIPGEPNQFLVAESGYVGGKYGRMFHIRIDEGADNWALHVVKVLPLPNFLHTDCEGIALGAKTDGSLVLVLSERGGGGPYSPAWLWWGDFDLSSGAFTRTEDQMFGVQLNWPEKTCYPSARPCSDLYLDQGGYLWASGAEDMGDNGPFRSVVYRVGKFDPTTSYPIQYDMNPDMVWDLAGLKVEALGPAVVEGSVLSFATDDENYGGIWRPLPPAEPQPSPQPYYGYGD